MKGIYLVGGYPDRESFRDRVREVARTGFDFIEVGIPFSDPVADGPVIAGAMARTLASGITPAEIAADIKDLETGDMPVYVMTYANVIFRYGPGRLSHELAGCVKGAILADCPNRMQPVMREAGLALPIIPFLTPESREPDVAALRDTDAPFIYFIGIRGITGSVARPDSPDIRQRVDWLRQTTGKPVVLGFGIRTGEQVRKALEIADGCVVGTAAVSVQHDADRFRSLLRSLTGSPD